MIKFQSGGLTQANAYYMATMSDEQRAAMAEQQRRQRLGQSATRLGAGALDFFGGRRAQREAEGQIDELGAQADEIRAKLGEMRAPGSMDPSTVAEATRNAAILGFQSPAEDPADQLAAQAMALQSGADPTKLYAAATQQDQAADAQRRAEAQGQFQQGLGMAQEDALNRFKQDYQQQAMELGDVENQLAQAQQESLMAQQRKQAGTRGLVTGAVGAASDYKKGDIQNWINKITAPMGGEPQEEDDGDDTTGSTGSTTQGSAVNQFKRNYDGSIDLDGNPATVDDGSQAHGGSVQQTPGEYDHDTNDMILMAQGKDGMLIDTGIRQTGGEYVIDPFDAGNMRQAFDKIDPLELEAVRTGRAKLSPDLVSSLMQMYDAVRFVKEPQFDDDYYEKKMNGYG
jgi:hypothetical protein